MSVQRYKVGYYTDEWGMSSNTPCLLRDDNGYAVKFDDYALLKKQRDELLAALDITLAQHDALLRDFGLCSADTIEQARAVLASVKGEQ